MNTGIRAFRLTAALCGLAVFVCAPTPAPASPATISPSWIADGDQSGALFGGSVAGAGDVDGDGFADVIVGAHLHQNASGLQGRAYLYRGTAAGLAPAPAWIAEGTADDQGLGYSVAGAGDVNGDGYDDVIVGVAYNPNVGRAMVFHGSAAGLSSVPDWLTPGAFSFGAAVSGAGDVNGDGYSDVIVGAWKQWNSVGDEGFAYVYHGSPGGLSPTPAWVAEGNQLAAWFGWSVAGAGDVNGDGYGDVVVGAPGSGRAFVYLGSATGLAPSPAWTSQPYQGGSRYGTSVAAAGDVNGDGYSDVIVGAPEYDGGESNEGRAFVYLGAPAGLVAAAAWIAEIDQVGALFGNAVAGAGDIDGDGYSDVIVGAHQFDDGQPTEGGAFLYRGSAAGLQPGPAWTGQSDQADAFYGGSVAGVGDVTGSGYSAVLVGASQFRSPLDLEGRAFLYTSVPVGVTPDPQGPARLWLAPASPNPSGHVSELRYTLPAGGRVRLSVYDIAGREVARIADGVEEAGPHTARWDGLDARGDRVGAGVYLARLDFAGLRLTRKLVREP